MPLLLTNNEASRVLLDTALLFVGRRSAQAGTLPGAR